MNDYLNNKEIEGVTYEINDDYICIQSSEACTRWIVSDRMQPINKTEALNLYKHVVKLAKEQGISLSYKSKFKQILSNPDIYQVHERANKLFDDMIVLAFEVEKRGIHCGYSDDEVLHSLTSKGWEYRNMHLHGQPLGKAYQAFTRLEELKQALSTEDNGYIKITI